MIIRTTCRTCQTHLVAYLHNQLSPRTRRRVGQHLSHCAACYGVYVGQRGLSQELAADLPRVGQATTPQLGRVWTAIQADMARPRTVPRRHVMRYTFAVAVLVLAVLLPWSLNTRQIALAVPSHPTVPLTETVTETPPSQVVMARATLTADVTNPAIPAAETPTADPNGAD